MRDVMNKKFGIKGESATWKMIALFTFHKRVCQDKCVSFFDFFPAVPGDCPKVCVNLQIDVR